MAAAGTVGRVVEIVILNWNGLEDTLACVSSVLASEFSGAFRVQVIDNGSDGDDAALMRERWAGDPRVRVAANPENLGFTGGMNQAMAELLAAGSELIVLLNNDTVVAADWLAQLVATADRTGAGIVASRMVDFFAPERLDNAGHDWLNTGEILPRGTGEPEASYAEDATLIGGCAGAILFRASMLEDVGLFDPYFHTGYEDAEHGLRAFLAGYPTHYCAAARVQHKVSQSIDKVRDFDYSVGIQKNINYTIVKLTPWPALLVNGPFILLKTIAVPLTALLFGRWVLFRAHVAAIRRTLRDLPTALRARRSARHLRRIGMGPVFRAQRFFLATYLGYFRRYLMTGKKTVFER